MGDSCSGHSYKDGGVGFDWDKRKNKKKPTRIKKRYLFTFTRYFAGYRDAPRSETHRLVATTYKHAIERYIERRPNAIHYNLYLRDTKRILRKAEFTTTIDMDLCRVSRGQVIDENDVVGSLGY